MRSFPGVRFELVDIDSDNMNAFDGMAMAGDPDVVLEAVPEFDNVSNY